MVFSSQRNQESQFFGRKGKKRKSLGVIIVIPFTTTTHPVFFEPPVPPTIQAHGTSPPTQGRGRERAFWWSLHEADVESWVLALPTRNHHHLPPPQAGGPHPHATGGEGCVCGSRMTTPQKTNSFLEATKVFNFFFLQDFSIFS